MIVREWSPGLIYIMDKKIVNAEDRNTLPSLIICISYLSSKIVPIITTACLADNTFKFGNYQLNCVLCNAKHKCKIALNPISTCCISGKDRERADEVGSM